MSGHKGSYKMQNDIANICWTTFLINLIVTARACKQDQIKYGTTIIKNFYAI